MTDPTQDLIARLRFAAMDTLNRDQVRADARAAADWIAAAHRRTHSPGLALSEAADCIVRQVSEIERLKKLIASGLAKVEADETLFVWAVEARAALEVKP